MTHHGRTATVCLFYFERNIRKWRVWSCEPWLRWFIKAESWVESGVNVGCLWRLTALTQQRAGLYNDSPSAESCKSPCARPLHRATDTFLSGDYHGWEGRQEPRGSEVLPAIRDRRAELGQIDVDHHPQPGVRCDQVPGGGEQLSLRIPGRWRSCCCCCASDRKWTRSQRLAATTTWL